MSHKQCLLRFSEYHLPSIITSKTVGANKLLTCVNCLLVLLSIKQQLLEGSIYRSSGILHVSFLVIFALFIPWIVFTDIGLRILIAGPCFYVHRQQLYFLFFYVLIVFTKFVMYYCIVKTKVLSFRLIRWDFVLVLFALSAVFVLFYGS